MLTQQPACSRGSTSGVAVAFSSTLAVVCMSCCLRSREQGWFAFTR
jgi:hypothetical protein